MTKIILNGCNGKMGKVISETVKKFENLSIVAGIDKNTSSVDYPVFSNIKDCNIDADVLLDFSRPDSLKNLMDYAKLKNIPLIICTTGHSDEQLKEIENFSKELAIFRSANMSIGINVINNILKNISNLLYNNYDIEIIEKHHNQKVDAPSGTALLLANTIKNSIKEETSFIYGREGSSKKVHNKIGIHAIRGGSIVGEHEVIFAGQGETIEIKHTAISREVFAVGALKACEFMYNKAPGLYCMDDIIRG
ncbi:4-hydroxy-tetrahydrodipicolinate reductase [Clostridium acetireducens DSM 10703]|jgi:4-hydroxy-tetrahydrodipicolinate reductase|uniref:4-hydroxy-tetrahydrodipicolinate reductase n=1 Tax=Clostridium acetireducens DSM 10703 TaxID=1121290 RepID=A0A1E8EYN9_9CLOT|nr:4-hydroxy-tetrahydrodipicolinate reductase [Clostridium acetireducens]OFI06124.1 4-hydroxy-tetrahydrodipicolinate reductase [Clostridium acetireducens DSM 10703]